MDRIVFALLLREAVEELAERLFARKFGRELRLETAAVEFTPSGLDRRWISHVHTGGRPWLLVTTK